MGAEGKRLWHQALHLKGAAVAELRALRGEAPPLQVLAAEGRKGSIRGPRPGERTLWFLERGRALALRCRCCQRVWVEPASHKGYARVRANICVECWFWWGGQKGIDGPIARAKRFLYEFLKDGPRPARDVYRQAAAQGLTPETVIEAGTSLGIRRTRGEPWALPASLPPPPPPPRGKGKGRPCNDYLRVAVYLRRHLGQPWEEIAGDLGITDRYAKRLYAEMEQQIHPRLAARLSLAPIVLR